MRSFLFLCSSTFAAMRESQLSQHFSKKGPPVCESSLGTAKHLSRRSPNHPASPITLLPYSAVASSSHSRSLSSPSSSFSPRVPTSGTRLRPSKNPSAVPSVSPSISSLHPSVCLFSPCSGSCFLFSVSATSLTASQTGRLVPATTSCNFDAPKQRRFPPVSGPSPPATRTTAIVTPRFFPPCLLSITFLFLLSFFPPFLWEAHAQIVRFADYTAPKSLSAYAQYGAFYIYDKGTHFSSALVGRKQAGADQQAQPSAVVTFSGLSFSEKASKAILDEAAAAGAPPGATAALAVVSAVDAVKSAVSPAAVEINLVPYVYAHTIFNVPLEKGEERGRAASFCCPLAAAAKKFVPTVECPYPGALKRIPPAATASPHQQQQQQAGDTSNGSGTSVNFGLGRPIALHNSAAAKEEITVEVEKGGIYYLVVSNCGGMNDLVFTGEVRVRNAYGYLPGHEYPKLVFYFFFSIVYALVCLGWGQLMYRQRANLIAFHKWMLMIGMLGCLECLALFIYLYDYNRNGERSSALLVFSVLASVAKNICSYVLVLLGSLGWSITIPVLDRKTVLKIKVVVVLYVILDTARQVSDQFSHTHALPLIVLLVCLFPVAALNGVLFYWIISSISNNVEMLQQQKQHEKLLMYKRLYAVLLLATVLAIIDLLCHIYVASLDASYPWKDQWWLSDAVPHFLFLLVLIVMMFIWRPNYQSRRLAYFTELGDADEVEGGEGRQGKNATAMQVWGEELDFQDQFSEEELDAGIPNFKLHSVGSLSEEGEYSDGNNEEAATEAPPPARNPHNQLLPDAVASPLSAEQRMQQQQQQSGRLRAVSNNSSRGTNGLKEACRGEVELTEHHQDAQDGL